ncbi:uncharacterized protein LOC117825320 isoform X2 [Notolabrus celidotus]|uniref:uncharacterized protein LOC117825320 isoform X2 n=1 Tax=Notolabrus celidotus TaxID=1203425 RepID=UPI00148F50B7|nr:uncharacterized protein LOC117825320 isoform X2 [Notolabrus celidotus]
MALHWNLNHSLNEKLTFCLLALLWHFAAKNAAVIRLKGEVGGEVIFRCPVERRDIQHLFLQKDLSFVNGYYKEKVLPSTWPNTKMDKETMTVHMNSLNVSHEGNYDCLIEYTNTHETLPTVIHLSITANFSVPAYTVLHQDETHWLVTCSSHGGYPTSTMIWNTDGSEMVKVVNSSEMTDPITLTINSSSTALFNCSKGEMKLISCSVGSVTSPLFSVCTSKPPDPQSYSLIIVATILVGVTLCVTFVCLWHKRKKRHEGTPAAPVRQNQLNGNEGSGTTPTREEKIALTAEDAP